ncbi:MAG TPA: hypothetical protein VEK07_19775 [Polyangiaceae bacterium]|nr:hypothetical protein [Polyangiaceae bacterium]
MRAARLLSLGGACLMASCGYHPIYGGGGVEPLHVTVVRTLVPDATAVDEVASGMREELARSGALAPGDGYPRAEVEVLRSDETSEGIAAGSNGPVARGIEVGLVARAWIVRGAGGAPQLDTGDLRSDEVITVDESGGLLDPRAALFHTADARRSAARRLGRKLAAKLLGYPGATEEPFELP